MSKVKFSFNGVNTTIQCNSDTKMKDICLKYMVKAQINKKDVYFTYSGFSGPDFNEELSFYEMANQIDKENNEMNVLVTEINNDNDENNKNNFIKSKSIICPECGEKSRIKIKDYFISSYDCKNRHEVKDIKIEDFEKTQLIDLSKIECGKCKNNNKGTAYQNVFYKCLNCKMNLCPLCKSAHDKSHIILNHDDINFFCEQHNERYIKYCNDCKKNFCIQCEDEHKGHKDIYLGYKIFDKEKLEDSLKIFREYIDKLKNDANGIIEKFNKVIENFENLYKIKEDIVNNYEKKNRNYELLHNLEEINNNEKLIIEDINSLIKEENISNKVNNILNIYHKMTEKKIEYSDEIRIIYKNDNNNQGVIKIFGKNFIKNNNNCKIIYNGKEYDLTEELKLNNSDINKDKIEIKLKGINTITNASYMFFKCKLLLDLPDICKWNTINVTDMSFMFAGCVLLKSLKNISNWNTSNITVMHCMFADCSSLLDISGMSEWNISNVTDMNCMFNGCLSLSNLPDISKWDTSKLKDIGHIFCRCSSLTKLPDISKWNTSNVTDMGYMFNGCSSLTSLPDINKWDVKDNTNINWMFDGCPKNLKVPSKFLRA